MLAIVSVIVCGIFICPGFATANPTLAAPEGYLDINGLIPEAVPMGAEAIKLYETFRELVGELEKKIDSKKYSAAFVAQQRFIRLNSRLRNFAEPLSFDLQVRSEELFSRFYIIRTTYIPSPECAEIAKKITLELRKKEKPRLKLVEQIRQLVEKKEWLEVETLWDKSMASFWQQLAFIDGAPLAEFASAFYRLEDAIKPARESQRIAQFLKVVSENHQIHQQQRDAFLSMIRMAPGQLANAGHVVLDGKSISGSAAVKRFVIDFGPLHADLMKDAALDYLKTSTSTVLQSSGLAGSSNHPSAPWNNAAATATRELQEAILALINTDAQGSGTLAANEYVDYLKNVALALHRLSPSTVPEDFTPALDLVAKKVGIDKPVAAYREATKDVLAWRIQIANRMANKLRQNDFPELDAFIRENLVKNPSGSPRMSAIARGTPIPTIIEPVGKLLLAGWENVRGKLVSASEVVRFDSDKGLLMSRLVSGIYARPVSSLVSPESLAKLRMELLVDDTHPALDLISAHAIYEAESGEVIDLGGEISGMNFEAMSNRILKLPAIAGNFLRYPVVQSSVYPKDELSGLCIRFDLKPKWTVTHYQFNRFP